MARTDARAGLGLEEALERCKEFRKIGADITFLEAPQSEEEMRRYCQEVDGPKLANMLEVRQVVLHVFPFAFVSRLYLKIFGSYPPSPEPNFAQSRRRVWTSSLPPPTNRSWFILFSPCLVQRTLALPSSHVAIDISIPLHHWCLSMCSDAAVSDLVRVGSIRP